jgi:hypothetical protein
LIGIHTDEHGGQLHKIFFVTSSENRVVIVSLCLLIKHRDKFNCNITVPLTGELMPRVGNHLYIYLLTPCCWTSLAAVLPFPMMLLTSSVLSTSREKSGVAGFCSVMVVMSSYLRSYGPSSGRAGGSLGNSHVHRLKNWHSQ